MVPNLSGAARGDSLRRDTFGDVFARSQDPEQFQSCFMAWTQAIAELLPEEVVAIDGKTARRPHDCFGWQGSHASGQRLGHQNTLGFRSGQDGGDVQ